MAELDEETIKIKAHQIWESEGRPHGRDFDHWEMAKQQIMTDQEQGQDPLTEPSAVVASSVSAEQQPAEPVPAGRAVGDEDPDYSPMDEARRRSDAKQGRTGLQREVREETELPQKGSA